MNILLNETNFDQDWAAETLVDILKPQLQVLILPLSGNYGWSSDAADWQDRFERGSDYHYDLMRPFRSYGIPKDHISFLNCFDEEPETAAQKLKASDLVFLVGEDPDDCMNSLEDMGLVQALQNYRGIVMGASAGAKIQLEQYYRTLDDEMLFDYHPGLGLVSGFDLESHYEEDPFHLTGIIRALESGSSSVIVLPRQGGALISGANIDLLGDAFIATANDLDELYERSQGF